MNQGLYDGFSVLLRPPTQLQERGTRLVTNFDWRVVTVEPAANIAV